MLKLEFWVSGAILFVISLFYNRLAGYLERRGFPVTLYSLMVVVGVFYTLFLGGFVVGWETVIVIGLLFICSGAPLLAGGVSRFFKSRESEEERLLDLARKANTLPRRRRHGYMMGGARHG